MKRILLSLIIATSLVSCGCNSNNERNNVSIQTQQVPGFNVQNFSEVVKKTSNPDAIEKAINEPNNVVNNLDLNNDGKVDFLKVNEDANTIQVIDNDVDPNVTVATLNVTPQGNNQASMNIQGTPQYCGNDYSYHSSFTLTDMLLLHYMITPHVYYHPYYIPYYHPPYYHPYTRTTYRTVPVVRSNTTNIRSTPNVQKNVTPDRRSISNPNTSQRRFETNKSNDGSFRRSNFGRSNFGGSSPKSSFGYGRSSFGSGRSSFGGGRRR